MNDNMILRVTAQKIAPVLLVLSFIVFWRGHQLPGGGFIGGLIAAGAFTLKTMAHGEQYSRKKLILEPFTWIVLGLAMMLVSGCIPLFLGYDFLWALWMDPWKVPLIGKIQLGTPLLFDFGVYLAVTGVTIKTIWNLNGKDD